MSTATLSCDDIIQAHQTIDTVFLNTPQFELDALNALLGIRLILKVETLNPIRSFKGRGTDYFVRQYIKQQAKQQAPASALVCASAGNFGQGMAYACRQQQIPLTVFAAETANPLKLDRMQQLGANVKLAGTDFDAAKTAGTAYAAEYGLPYVEDGREPAVTVGAGTIGLELCQYPELIDTLLIPLGNGALINGIGTWFKTHSPETQVIGVVAEGAPAMDWSWKQGKLITAATIDTIADGIGIRVPVPEALALMQTTVDDIVQVTDSAILAAMQQIHQLAGVVVEPAGAVGLAAAQVYRERFAGQLVATPLCGSNLTVAQMEQWLLVGGEERR
ncbi:MAG: pyridoxal-phosphate dependent enzyme [Cyanobacteria bacterium P01_D01_bin.14]